MRILPILLALTVSCGTEETPRDGSPGEKGDHTTIYNGKGLPTDVIGGDGDIYIDDETGDLYKKHDHAWIKQTNIMGPTGSQGEQGEKGDKGEPGEVGATGAAGSAGEQGSSGTNMRVSTIIECTDLVPNYTTHRIRYKYVEFSTGDVFVTAILHDDEYETGSTSNWWADSQTEADTGVIKIYTDRQLNDDWAEWTFSVNTSTLDFTIDYKDTVDGDQNYTLSDKCTKTAI
jgi:hypothetical protein